MISDRDKLQCVERELRMRHKVYPRWIAAKRMTEATAEREIEVMRAIYEDYRKACGVGDLFE
jgi:hypothetical protein